jgi:hypothetical protein
MTTGTNARHVREVDRIPDGGAPPSGSIDVEPMLGMWRNANHRTWGICAVSLSLNETDGRIWAHAWAADPGAGEIHDWGEVPLDGIYADGPRSRKVCGYRATFELPHARTQIQVNVLHSISVCAAFTTFTDGSGRANYMSREFLHRRGE